MFDAKLALFSLVGKQFNSVELRKAFEDILVNHIKEIPAEFRASDLFELAINNKLLVESDGIYEIRPSLKELTDLWQAVKKWIEENEPLCPESILQQDSVNLALPDLAWAVCYIVGYAIEEHV